ncbi:MAG: peptidase [Ruminiclostridium sp.]|nr:peptidase [Ruminiclostridium sp.]
MIFLFIDGLGLGERDIGRNPVYAADTPNLDYIFSKYDVIAADASLGVPGLPQSATGQTAIVTGVNAPMLLGRHLNAQPSGMLKNLINEDNIFKRLVQAGFKVTNANVYRQEYLDKMNDPAERRYKPSVSSVMTMSAGLPFRMVDDYRNGKGIYHDITGRIIAESGYDAEIITPGEAAYRLYSISRENDFTFFEHFLTDIIGHKMDMGLAIKDIELLDAFIGGILKLADPQKDIIFITSDHGNIEDISVKTHTMNKVPVIIIGGNNKSRTVRIRSLLDIMPAVLEIFGLWEVNDNRDGK